MEKLKKVIMKLLYPNIVFSIILFIVSITMMLLSMIFLGITSILTIISYVLSFYSLSIVCLQIPRIIKKIKKIKEENKYIKLYFSDATLRINISLYLSLIINVAYVIFQLCLGFYHGSFWFYSMAIYYFMLAIMRVYLVSYTTKYKPGERMDLEIKRYNICGWLTLIMNLAVTIIIFFIIYWNRTFYHHQITTIAIAAFTFYSLTNAIVQVVKYRKYNSPVFSATKALSLIASSVSMITLTTTMLTTFGTDEVMEFKPIMQLAIGVVVAIFIIIVAIFMIVGASKKRKTLIVD